MDTRSVGGLWRTLSHPGLSANPAADSKVRNAIRHDDIRNTLLAHAAPKLHLVSCFHTVAQISSGKTCAPKGSRAR